MNNKIVSWLFALYMLVSFSSLFTISAVLPFAFLFLSILMYCSTIDNDSRDKTVLQFSIVFLVWVTALFLLRHMGTLNDYVKMVISIVSNVLVGLSLLKTSMQIRPTLLAFILITVQMISMSILGNYFLWSSLNMVSSFSLVFGCAIILQQYKIHEGFLLTSTIIAIACMFSSSRAGFIISAMLFLFALISSYTKTKSKQKRILLSLFVIGVLGVLIYRLPTLMQLEASEKIQEYGTGLTGREVIWANYLTALDFKGIILGLDLDSLSEISFYNLNPHNSWIKLHSQTGIIGIVIMLMLLVRIKNSFKSKDFVFLFCLICIISRALTDTILFYSSFDFIIVMFLFYGLYNKSSQISDSI